MKQSGIYKIQSKIKPNRFYIGSSVNIIRRWDYHKSYLSRGLHGSSIMQNHVNKYDIDDFEFSIIELVEIKENLINREQFYIDTLKPYFNSNKIADSPLGRKYSEESKLKRRGKNAPFFGKHHTKEAKLKLRLSHLGKNSVNYGKKMPIEIRNKISASNKGKHRQKRSEETKLKIGLSKLGNKFALGYKHTEDAKNRMSYAKKNISEETREKFRIVAKNRIFSDETREKISKAKKGRKTWSYGIKLSEETKLKMSESHKKHEPNKKI